MAVIGICAVERLAHLAGSGKCTDLDLLAHFDLLTRHLELEAPNEAMIIVTKLEKVKLVCQVNGAWQEARGAREGGQFSL